MQNNPLQIKDLWCKGCGICYALCPKKAISEDEKGKVVLIKPELCSGCGICEFHCPDYAIFVRSELR